MEIFHTLRADPTLLARLDRLMEIGQQIIQKENQMAHTLQELVDAVAAETTDIGSLKTFIQGLQDQISGIGLSADQQAKVDKIFDNVATNDAAVVAAMAINVQVIPVPVSVPPVV